MKSYKRETDVDTLDDFLDAFLKEDRGPKLPVSLYFSEGTKQLYLRQYDKAVTNFSIALNRDPTNARALVKRCKAYLGLQQYTKAKEDATEALRLWPDFSEALDLLGRSEYLMGDFEGSYLTYLKGRKVRPRNERLRLGQQLSKEAMDYSMLVRSGTTVDVQDIKSLLEPRTTDLQLPKRHWTEVCNYKRFTKDKMVLEELLSDESLKSVHGICNKSLEVIKNSQSFWAMQMPLHTRRITIPRRQIARRTSVLQYVTSIRNQCQDHLEKGLSKFCVSEGQKLIGVIESRPELTLRQKMILKADVLHLLSLAYEKENEESLSLEQLEKELVVAQKYGLVQAEIRSLHLLGDHFLKKEMLTRAYYCLEKIKEVLDSDRLKKFLTDHQAPETTKNRPIDAKEISDIRAAELWTRKFNSRLKGCIQDSIVISGEDLVSGLNQIQRDTTHQEGNISRSFVDTESDDTETYYTADNSCESEISS